MNIKEMKERRSSLWADLKELINTVSEQEKAIRAEIKEIQDELYVQEMTPVMYALIKKESDGTITDGELGKLAMLKDRLS